MDPFLPLTSSLWNKISRSISITSACQWRDWCWKRWPQPLNPSLIRCNILVNILSSGSPTKIPESKGNLHRSKVIARMNDVIAAHSLTFLIVVISNRCIVDILILFSSVVINFLLWTPDRPRQILIDLTALSNRTRPTISNRTPSLPMRPERILNRQI